MVGRPVAQAEAGRCVLHRARNLGRGIGLNFTPLDPIKALYWSVVINGVLAPPVMVLMMLLVRRKKVMGELQVEGGCTGLGGSRPSRWSCRSSEWRSASRRGRGD
jgi:Natural resistance-associated macrophage protein